MNNPSTRTALLKTERREGGGGKDVEEAGQILKLNAKTNSIF